MCRNIGCPNPAEPGLHRCVGHQLHQWERVPLDLRSRFASRMVEGVTTNPSGWWLYAGPRNPVSGYAVGEHAGGRTSLHRWMTWYLKGFLKLDHEQHHICGGLGEQDTRHCIRPAHLVQIRPDDHREQTRLRAQMIVMADPGSRFYQTNTGETGRTVAFAQAHDLPRHEPQFNIEVSTAEALVADWHLVIPERMQNNGE